MLDFLSIATSNSKRGTIEIRPIFRMCKSKDLMIRGRDFYAIWDERKNLWSTDEQSAIDLIDIELDKFAEEKRSGFGFDAEVIIKHMWDSSSGSIDKWHQYCQKQMRDSYHPLDSTLIFANDEVKKESYASRKLPYALAKSDTPAYEELMSTLYSSEERNKIEWAIGSIVNGDSKEVQKMVVLYGDPGSGKTTVLNIIKELFCDYCCTFSAKRLVNRSDQFSLEPFKSDPLVAIDPEADLSRIEDNTTLNSLVSHDPINVNEKYKSSYTNYFQALLFAATNKPVKITDSKSGLLRRLIDVTPTGQKIPKRKYLKLVKDISFELGGIAWHCKEVYEKNPDGYDDYEPLNMMNATNDFFNFIVDSYFTFVNQEETSLKQAWDMYKQYCVDANVNIPYPQRVFKQELKTYFKSYREDIKGNHLNIYYVGFKKQKVHPEKKTEKKECR